MALEKFRQMLLQGRKLSCSEALGLVGCQFRFVLGLGRQVHMLLEHLRVLLWGKWRGFISMSVMPP